MFSTDGHAFTGLNVTWDDWCGHGHGAAELEPLAHRSAPATLASLTTTREVSLQPSLLLLSVAVTRLPPPCVPVASGDRCDSTGPSNTQSRGSAPARRRPAPPPGARAPTTQRPCYSMWAHRCGRGSAPAPRRPPLRQD